MNWIGLGKRAQTGSQTFRCTPSRWEEELVRRQLRFSLGEYAYLEENTMNRWVTFGFAAFLAVVSAVGLVAALVGDGVFDLLSWVALGIPVVVILLALAGRLPD